MENPYQPTAEVHQSRPAKSQLFVFARAMALGLAVSGIILGALPLLLAMANPIAASCEILGGAMIVLAGVLLLLAVFLARGKMRGRATHNWIAGGLFLTLGSILFAKGYGTVSANRKRLTKRNRIWINGNKLLKTTKKARQKIRGRHLDTQVAANNQSMHASGKMSSDVDGPLPTACSQSFCHRRSFTRCHSLLTQDGSRKPKRNSVCDSLRRS